MTEKTEKDALSTEELEAQSGEELPDREVMSILPQPDGFVYIEPAVEPDPGDPPADDPKIHHVDW
jgi:hypothetical protein